MTQFPGTFTKLIQIAREVTGKTETYLNQSIPDVLSNSRLQIQQLKANNGNSMLYVKPYYSITDPGEYGTATSTTIAVLCAISLALDASGKNTTLTYLGVLSSIAFGDVCEMVGVAVGLQQLRLPNSEDYPPHFDLDDQRISGLFGLAWRSLTSGRFMPLIIQQDGINAGSGSLEVGSFTRVPVLIRSDGARNVYCFVDSNTIDNIILIYNDTGIWKPEFAEITNFVPHTDPREYPSSFDIFESMFLYGASFNGFQTYPTPDDAVRFKNAWSFLMASDYAHILKDERILEGSRFWQGNDNSVRLSFRTIPATENPDNLYWCEQKSDGFRLWWGVQQQSRGTVHSFRIYMDYTTGGIYTLNRIQYETGGASSYININYKASTIFAFGELTQQSKWVVQDPNYPKPDVSLVGIVEKNYPDWYNSAVFVPHSYNADTGRLVGHDFVTLLPNISTFGTRYITSVEKERGGLIVNRDGQTVIGTDVVNTFFESVLVEQQTSVNPGAGTVTGPSIDVNDPTGGGGSGLPSGGGSPGAGDMSDQVPDTGTVEKPPVAQFSGIDSGLYNVYTGIPITTFMQFNKWLWSPEIIDTFVKHFANPLGAILSLGMIFVNPQDYDRTEYVNIGNLSYPMGCQAVKTQFVTLDCGTIFVNKYHDNAMDYEPFTRISAYLPFVGFKEWPTADIMDSSVNVQYSFDVVSGQGVCSVYVIRNGNGFSAPLYEYECNCLINIPLGSSDFSRLYTALAGACIGVATGAVAGGAAAVASLSRREQRNTSLVSQKRADGAFGGALQAAGAGALNTISGGVSIATQGSIGPISGALAPRKPFLIIRRSQPYMSDDYSEFQGFPSNVSAKLSSLSGFTRVREVHITGVPATDGEIDMIDSALKEGIII